MTEAADPVTVVLTFGRKLRQLLRALAAAAAPIPAVAA
jgi:hypothetical protein